MDKMMKECMKPHAVMHILTGIGLGLILVGIMPTLVTSATMYGLIILIGGVVLDMWVQSSKK